ACGRSAVAQADPRAPGVRPQHPAVRWRRSSAARRARGGAHAQHRGLVRGRDGQSGRRGTRSGSMNTPSDAAPESAVEAPALAPAATAATRPMYWSVRRELWENRSIHVAPLVAAAVMPFGFLIRAMTLPRRMPA